jgi:hypothetical protein
LRPSPTLQVRGDFHAGGHIGKVGLMVRGRLTSLAAIGAAVVALGLPAGASAQGGGPFPDDQQPIADEYGLPPLDHPAHSGGGGGAGGANSSGTLGSSGAGSTGASLSVSDVRRGEHGRGARGGSGHGGAQTVPRERVGIGKPVPPPTANATDTRSGFDVLLLVLVGLAAAGLVVAALGQRRRPGRPT